MVWMVIMIYMDDVQETFGVFPTDGLVTRPQMDLALFSRLQRKNTGLAMRLQAEVSGILLLL